MIWTDEDALPRSPVLARRIEIHYALQLRRLARHIAEIVRGLAPDGAVPPAVDDQIGEAMRRYGEVLEPWARAVGGRMIADVDRQDARSWMAHGARVGRALRRELDNAPTGAALRARLAEQVTLISSLPTEAARRVHALALDGLVEGRRPAEIAAEIMRTGEVSASRATLIARTEVARTSSVLTEVRAKSLGCTHFQWMTARDAQVRPSHRAQQGRVFAFAEPPIVDGQPLLPGQTFNCRCRIAPILPN